MNTPLSDDELKQITQQLAGLELPPAPDWQPLIIATLVVLIALLLAVALIYLRSRRQQPGHIDDQSREALHQLHLLQQQWLQQSIDDHDAAYRLATLLRLGLGLNQLTNTAPPALIEQQQRWQQLQQQLIQLRYTPAESRPPLSADLFTQVETWLIQGRPEC